MILDRNDNHDCQTRCNDIFDHFGVFKPAQPVKIAQVNTDSERKIRDKSKIALHQLMKKREPRTTSIPSFVCLPVILI